MRLSQQRKAQVLEAARRWMLHPALVRIDNAWGVVGRADDDPRRWSSQLICSVDADGKVWWSDIATGFRTRKAAVEALRRAA